MITENEFDQNILFGQEYHPDRKDNYNAEDLKILESKLEPKRAELEKRINDLINNCVKEHSLQQIVLVNKNEKQSVRFIVDLDKTKF